MPCKLQLQFPCRFHIQIYGIISFLFLSQLKSLCPINPATLTWCCGFLGSVMITALENEESRVCRLVSLLVIVQSLLFWDHRSDFVNLGMSHLARCSLEGHNRHVVSFPVCPSPSKFSIIARTCLVQLETFGQTLKGLLILPTTQRNLHVSLPVSPNLKKNCSPRVHSRSEAVESRESMTFWIHSDAFSSESLPVKFTNTLFLWIGVSSPSSWDWAQGLFHV